MGILSFFKRNLRGDQIVQLKNDNPKLRSYFDLMYHEGVRDEDIAEWWNMPDSQHKSIQEEDDVSKLVTLKQFIDQGILQKEAIKKTFKTFPIYGDPTDLSNQKGRDRPLPYEIKDRVNRFVIQNSSNNNVMKSEISKFSSMNSYIRDKIKRGQI